MIRLARAAALAATLVAGAAAAETKIGLDHVVVVVRDLEAAARDFRALGFTLKPGRPHANGIRNFHAKFTDGTEIELLTAPEKPTDALTARYRKFLERGDGPAALALFAPGDVPAETLDYLFFGRRNHSPTDRREHFRHRNGARSLIGVTLVGSRLDAERRLLTRIGAAWRDTSIQMKMQRWPSEAEMDVGVYTEVAALDGGEILLMGLTSALERPISGVVLEIDSLPAPAPAREAMTVKARRDRVVHSHGLTIEFRSRSRPVSR